MICKCGCKREAKTDRRFIQGHHARVQPPNTAWCPTCQRFKHRNKFYAAPGKFTGFHPYCIACVAKRRRAHYLANTDVIKARSSIWTRRRSQQLRIKALEVYGGSTCACCLETGVDFLVIDHIEGGGSKHRRSIGIQSGGGASFYRWLERNNYPSGFRVLCHNCNMARANCKGACPHEQHWFPIS